MTPMQARLRDVPQLSRVMWRFTRATPWLPRSRTCLTDLRLMAKVTQRGWVRLIRDGQGHAGFIARDGARIHALYVHPRAQGRGVGQKLLDEAKAQVPQLELWVLQANTNARRFYARQGFTEQTLSQGGGNDENLPDILMVWSADERLNP